MPTFRIFAPPGTVYDDPITTGLQEVPVLAPGTIAQTSPLAGAALTVTGSNEVGALATYLWQTRAVAGEGAWGDGAGTNNQAGYTLPAGGGYGVRRGVSLPNQPTMVFTPEVTVGAAATRPLLIGTGQSLRSVASSPVTFVADTSLAQTGDRLIMLLSHSANRGENAALPAITAINGLSPGAPLFDEFGALFPFADSPHRRVIGYEYVMPAAGNNSFPIEVGKLGASVILTIWTVRGGAYASRAWASTTNATSVSNTITPSVAENLLLTSVHFGSGPGTINWNSTTTEQHVGTNSAGASNNTIGAVAHQIDASWPTAASGHMITLSVEAV